MVSFSEVSYYAMCVVCLACDDKVIDVDISTVNM